MQSGPGGWSDLKPHPGTPLLITGAATDVSIIRPGNFGPPLGKGGWGGAPPRSPRPTICWLLRCVIRNPAVASTPHSRHFNLLLCRPQEFGPFPIARISYASTDIFKGVWHGWKDMITVFCVFVLSLTWSKMPVRTSNALCRISGWFEATSPLLA